MIPKKFFSNLLFRLVPDPDSMMATPKMTEDEAAAKIGEGPVLIVMDATTLGTSSLREEIQNVAKKHNIKVQTDFTPGGGTDAGRMHLAHDGAPVISMAIATRYIHSHGSIIHEDDYNTCVDLIVNFINELKAK